MPSILKPLKTDVVLLGRVHSGLQRGECTFLLSKLFRITGLKWLTIYLQLAKYMKLDQKGSAMAEYVWIDGSNGLRSKTKVSCTRKMPPQLATLPSRSASTSDHPTVTLKRRHWKVGHCTQPHFGET